MQHESRICLHVANDRPTKESADSNDEEMIEDKDATLSLGNLLNIHTNQDHKSGVKKRKSQSSDSFITVTQNLLMMKMFLA